MSEGSGAFVAAEAFRVGLQVHPARSSRRAPADGGRGAGRHRVQRPDLLGGHPGRAVSAWHGRMPTRCWARSWGCGCQQFGQVAHVVEHDGVRSLQPRGRCEAAAVAEGPHSCGAGGLYSVGAVLDHRAPPGLHAHRAGGVQEEVGCGLAARDVGGAEDVRPEVVAQRSDLQAVPDAVVTAVRGDADGRGEAVQSLRDAVDSGQFGREGRLVQMLVLLLPVLLQAPSEPFFHSGRVDLGGRADEPLDDLGLGERAPQVGHDHRVHFDAYSLAVHQHAVTVEDHQFNRALCHGRKPRGLSSTRLAGDGFGVAGHQEALTCRIGVAGWGMSAPGCSSWAHGAAHGER